MKKNKGDKIFVWYSIHELMVIFGKYYTNHLYFLIFRYFVTMTREINLGNIFCRRDFC